MVLIDRVSSAFSKDEENYCLFYREKNAYTKIPMTTNITTGCGASVAMMPNKMQIAQPILSLDSDDFFNS